MNRAWQRTLHSSTKPATKNCLLTISYNSYQKIYIYCSTTNMRAGNLFPFLISLFFFTMARAQQTIIHYLSGTDKDHTVPWDFMVTTGSKSGVWSKIAVPSCWEQQGFGTFNYYEDKIHPEEEGFYKCNFKTDKAWRGKKIIIVFEGSMTDTEVRIDGNPAGPVHQGGFYQFRYDITELLKNGEEHLLEVTVRKRSANVSVNRAERQAD